MVYYVHRSTCLLFPYSVVSISLQQTRFQAMSENIISKNILISQASTYIAFWLFWSILSFIHGFVGYNDSQSLLDHLTNTTIVLLGPLKRLKTTDLSKQTQTMEVLDCLPHMPCFNRRIINPCANSNSYNIQCHCLTLMQLVKNPETNTDVFSCLAS
jgi:hypothetical protein